MKKIILYLLICLITIGSFTIANAEVADNEIVRIGVDEAIDNIDITTLNQYSKATDYIWTCMYDRLLEYDEAGELTGSLAKCIRVIPDPNAIYSPIDLNDYNLVDSVENMDEYGWMEFTETINIDDLSNICDIPDWIGKIYMEVTLNSNVYYHDGSNLDAYDLYNYIQYILNSGVNSRAYRQWLPVANMTVDDYDEFKILFELDFSSLNYGFIEFIYSLSSPISSIGKIENNENGYIGTGAYSLDETNNTSLVRLEKNSSWWNDNSSSVNYLEFVYDNQLGTQDQNVSYDIEIISSEKYIPTDEVENEYNTPDYTVANNPIIIKSNYNETFDNYLNAFVRSSAFNNSSQGILLFDDSYLSSMLTESYDYWVYCNKFDGSASTYEHNNLNILCKNTESAEYISSLLKSLYESINLYTNLNNSLTINLPLDNFYQEKNESIYDFYIDEVEVEAINSILTHLDQDNNGDELSIFPLLKRCLSFKAYQYFIGNIGMKLVSNNSIAFMGWTYKNIYINSQNLDVSGRINPTGFCPYGDAARIDLRFISSN